MKSMLSRVGTRAVVGRMVVALPACAVVFCSVVSCKHEQMLCTARAVLNSSDARSPPQYFSEYV